MLALACLTGYGVGMRFASIDGRHAEGNSQAPQAPIRATMVSSTGCVWGPGNTVMPLTDDRFASGDALQLLEGIAELKIDRGRSSVQLQLEGPASAVLTGHGTPSVSYGKIVAKTDGALAETYAIETSFGRVLIAPSSDVGLAAFGSSAEIHCFRGRATIESPWMRSTSEEIGSVAIDAGQSLQLADVGGASLEGRRGTADKERFTPQVSMSTDFLSVGVDYVRQVMEARPVAYYRFEDADALVARNEMADDHHCQVKGNVGRVGPRGNRSLELGFHVVPGSLVAAGSWDDALAGSFSIEAWIKPNHYHTGSIVGFVGDFDPSLERNRHGVLLETCGPASSQDWMRPKELRFLHRSQLTADSRDGVSVFSGRPYEARRWQHVAAVKDGGELRLYVNGALMQTVYEEHPTPKGLQLVIGQLYTESVERYFIGQLDEAAIYDRPLTESEIRRRYELLRGSPRAELDDRSAGSAPLRHVECKLWERG
jgi:hypothetical protein